MNCHPVRAPGLGLALLVALSGVAAPASTVSVTAVRHWSLGDVTRVAVEATGEFTYQYGRLSNPDRIYFDIHESRQRLSPDNNYVVDVDDGMISKIRVAQNRRGVVRVVLYLAGRLPVEDSRLTNPDRLVLEVRGTPQTKVAAAPQPAPAPAAKPPSGRLPDIVHNRPIQEPAPLAPLVEQPPAKPKPRPKVFAWSPTPLPAPQPARLAYPPPPEIAAPKLAAIAEPVFQSRAIPPPPEPEPEPEPDDTPVAQPAKSNQSGERSLTRVLGLKLGRIVIDPGHGGRDTGTIGPSGVREKDISLDVSRRLAKLVEERMGSEVVLTRDRDASVKLGERTRIANEKKADLFLSIHVNASRYKSVSGVETFYLNFTRSRADLEVAARENAGSNRSIHELGDLVQKIALDDKIQESADFASSVHGTVHEVSSKHNPGSKNRGVKKAPFVVLIGAKMPSVLVELGFISNERDEELLKSSAYRQELAEALYEGLYKYASTLSHFQVAAANGKSE